MGFSRAACVALDRGFALQPGGQFGNRSLQAHDLGMIRGVALQERCKTCSRQLELLRRAELAQGHLIQPPEAGAGRRGDRQCIGELALDEQPALLGAIGRLVQGLQLQVGVLNRLQVALQLRRHLAGVALAIVLELLFLFDEAPLRFGELRVEELAGVVGLGLAILRVLVDVQRGQSLGHLPCRFGIVADVADAKRVDVLPDRARGRRHDASSGRHPP